MPQAQPISLRRQQQKTGALLPRPANSQTFSRDNLGENSGLALQAIRRLDAAAGAAEAALEIEQIVKAARTLAARLKKIHLTSTHLEKPVEAMEKLGASKQKAAGGQTVKPEPEEKSTL